MSKTFKNSYKKLFRSVGETHVLGTIPDLPKQIFVTHRHSDIRVEESDYRGN